jgi:pyruvate formate lyase activating enzyme
MARHISRRDFVSFSIKGGLLLSAVSILESSSELKSLFGLDSLDIYAGDSLEQILLKAPRARFWIHYSEGSGCSQCHGAEIPKGDLKKAHKDEIVKCLLCAHECVIKEGGRGKCRARINIGGELKSLVYGRPITSHIDPIEKKPFFHFMPGSLAFSMATSGCPLQCKFCQNWQISQSTPEDYSTVFIPPSDITGTAKINNVPVIAFTYNEPTVFTEYLLDIAKEGKKSGLKSVIISCGFMQEEPLKEMIGALDAIKIDLKGFSEDFYRNVSKAELKPVLRSIKQVAKAGRHLEIVNLVVPTLNDKEEDLKNLAKFVFDETGPDTPLHFTKFHPDYQLLNLAPTPLSTLENARNIAMDIGLRYVYVGNVPGHPGNHTYCPKCKKIVIERQGFFIKNNNLKNGKCSFCGEPVKGVWS